MVPEKIRHALSFARLTPLLYWSEVQHPLSPATNDELSWSQYRSVPNYKIGCVQAPTGFEGNKFLHR